MNCNFSRMSWSSVLLLVICISISLPSIATADDGDNYKVIIGVGVGGLIVLIALWILLCFCLNCFCFGKKDTKGRINAPQKMYSNGYNNGPASRVEPWTVPYDEQQQHQYNQQQRQQYHSQYYSQQQQPPPAPQRTYSTQQQQPGFIPTPVHPPPHSNYTAKNTGPQQANTIGGVPIPEPDYYYDVDVSKPGGAGDPSSSLPVSPTTYGPTGKPKPIPPPKPKKFIPEPDY